MGVSYLPLTSTSPSLNDTDIDNDTDSDTTIPTQPPASLACFHDYICWSFPNTEPSLVVQTWLPGHSGERGPPGACVPPEEQRCRQQPKIDVEKQGFLFSLWKDD